jgi:tRNA (adenine57-N1/adenine58-N1)-methyltransferase
VKTKKGHGYRVHEASLADYVVLARRIVTPIYPAHANLIASLLELHPSDATSENKLEILEAGTGHGSLTLYLARAIHAANSKPPALPFPKAGDPKKTITPKGEEARVILPDDSALTEWKATRTGVVHTVDISARHSDHARLIVRNFRRGMYYGSVDFHVGDLPVFFEQHARQNPRNGPFLSHVLLDMPSAEDKIQIVAPHMKPDAKLLIFNPSVTQIAECVRIIEEQNLPFEMDRVIELPIGVAGGREWDVRLAKIRKPAANTAELKQNEGWLGWLRSLFSPPQQPVRLVQQMAFVCRPKIGTAIAVGGFVGVWRRKQDGES